MARLRNAHLRGVFPVGVGVSGEGGFYIFLTFDALPAL